MEHRLKKQRNRLFRRVTLILSAVWLFGFTIYCLISLSDERINLQNSTLKDFTYAKNVVFEMGLGLPNSKHIYLNTYSLMYYRRLIGVDNEAQLLVMDPDTKEVLADTAGKIELKFSLRNDKGRYPDDYCYLDREKSLSVISGSQLQRIAQWLDARGKDGRKYKLVCSKFYSLNGEIIPLELTVILTDDRKRVITDSDIIETFRLRPPESKQAKVFCCSEYYDNIIPKEFLFGDYYNHDVISCLTDEQREQSSAVFKVGFAEYVFYTSDYYYLNAYVFDEKGNEYRNPSKIYILRYAKKVNLIKSRFNDLFVGFGILSCLFLIVDVLLCLVIWENFKMPLIQEQRRRHLTNALAHDIKTPLFVISGYAYSLKEDIDPEERAYYIDKIIGQTDQITGMVHKMLNLSKLDSYVMTLNRSEFDLYELTKEVLDDFTVLPDGRSVEVTRSGDNLINADRELIRTVVQNLADNAVKYSLPDSRMTIDVTDQSFLIANPSEPLTKSELREIWQPYYRKDRSRHKRGNGLGLSIVKSILDLHGVRYDVSQKDGCVIFHIQFQR